MLRRVGYRAGLSGGGRAGHRRRHNRTRALAFAAIRLDCVGHDQTDLLSTPQARVVLGGVLGLLAERPRPAWRERAEVLGIRRYVQVRTLQQRELMAALQARNGGAPEPFDGIAELWYDEVGGRRSAESVEAGRVLLEDERNFIDLPASPMWFGEEWEVYPGR